MPSYPRNYPFYNWVPKWLGILILVLMFIPILTVGGVYSVNSTEMMSGLGIISEQFCHLHRDGCFLSVFIPAGGDSKRKNDVSGRFFHDVCAQLYLCRNRQYLFVGSL